jgi:hypothetical protein
VICTQYGTAVAIHHRDRGRSLQPSHPPASQRTTSEHVTGNGPGASETHGFVQTSTVRGLIDAADAAASGLREQCRVVGGVGRACGARPVSCSSTRQGSLWVTLRRVLIRRLEEVAQLGA